MWLARNYNKRYYRLTTRVEQTETEWTTAYPGISGLVVVIIVIALSKNRERQGLERILREIKAIEYNIGTVHASTVSLLGIPKLTTH